MKNDARFYIKAIGLTLLFGSLSVYGIFTARHLIEGPIITVTSPANGALVGNSLVEIQGNVQNISFITLNDRQIYADEKGNFKEKLLLYPGYSIMKLYAKDRFGREITKGLSLVYVAPKEAVQPDQNGQTDQPKTASSTTVTMSPSPLTKR